VKNTQLISWRLAKKNIVSLSLALWPVMGWSQHCLNPELTLASKLNAPTTTDPLANFDSLWRTLDEKYGLFQVKGLDWRSLYSQYRPQIGSEMKDEELFAVMARLLDHLQDKHVWLAGAGMIYNCRLKGPCSTADGEKRLEALKVSFSESLITDKYLIPNQTVEHGMGILSGLLLGGRIGYLRIRRFEDKPNEVGEIIDQAIQRVSQTKSLILDVRGNSGGTDLSVNAAANRFADRRRLFMISQVRNGPKHGDFEPAKRWYLDPSPKGVYTRLVVLLMDGNTLSAGETFCLAMRVLPHVTLMGETTAGAFSDAQDGKLPNGWEFTYSIGVWRDARGRAWEGKGIFPDIPLGKAKGSLPRSSDEALLAAMDRLAKLR
jgi:carboxyl-terminal processing protease